MTSVISGMEAESSTYAHTRFDTCHDVLRRCFGDVHLVPLRIWGNLIAWGRRIIICLLDGESD